MQIINSLAVADEVEVKINDFQPGVNLTMTLKTEEVREDMTAPICRVGKLCKEAVKEAGCGLEKISRVEVVGEYMVVPGVIKIIR